MIAAVVLLALVASTQAYPGDDFVEIKDVTRGSADYQCILGYLNKFAVLFANTETGAKLVEITQNCRGNKNLVSSLICVSEGARAAWNFPSFKNDVMTVYPQVVQYTYGLVNECFSH